MKRTVFKKILMDLIKRSKTSQEAKAELEVLLIKGDGLDVDDARVLLDIIQNENELFSEYFPKEISGICLMTPSSKLFEKDSLEFVKKAIAGDETAKNILLGATIAGFWFSDEATIELVKTAEENETSLEILKSYAKDGCLGEADFELFERASESIILQKFLREYLISKASSADDNINDWQKQLCEKSIEDLGKYLSVIEVFSRTGYCIEADLEDKILENSLKEFEFANLLLKHYARGSEYKVQKLYEKIVAFWKKSRPTVMELFKKAQNGDEDSLRILNAFYKAEFSLWIEDEEEDGEYIDCLEKLNFSSL